MARERLLFGQGFERRRLPGGIMLQHLYNSQIQLLNCRNNVKCDQMFCIFLEAGICRCVSADVDGLVAG